MGGHAKWSRLRHEFRAKPGAAEATARARERSVAEIRLRTFPPTSQSISYNAPSLRTRDELGTVPSRVVIHKQSQYSAEERGAFADAIAEVLTKSASFDLVGLRRTSDVRLVREGKYPPLRGTLAGIEDRAFLYSTGYLPYLGRYPHGHVPAPVEIIDHHGDSDPRRIFEEVLALTKLNWNSAGYAETMPITLRFSGLVGGVLREVPADRKPNPRYAFYVSGEMTDETPPSSPSSTRRPPLTAVVSTTWPRRRCSWNPTAPVPRSSTRSRATVSVPSTGPMRAPRRASACLAC